MLRGAGPLVRSRPMERTLVLCKPDAVERGLVGEIIGRLERKGLRITAMRMFTFDDDLAARHYAEHVEKPFFPELRSFVTRGPSVAMAVEGPEAWRTVRTLMGSRKHEPIRTETVSMPCLSQ